MTIKLPGEKGNETEKVGNRTDEKTFSKLISQRRFSILLSVMVIAALVATTYGVVYFLQSPDRFDSNIVRASGRIEASETHISAPTATRVKSVLIEEGDSVHKGQLIVVLDSNNLQKRMSQAAPALNAALHARKEADHQVAAVQKQIDEARAKSKGFFAKVFSTKKGKEKKELQLRRDMLQAKMLSMQARSAISSVESARSQASAKLSFFNITSPIDGLCATRSAQPGELVAAGQVMLTLISPDSAYVRGFVPESDAARIKIGQAAQVFLDSAAIKPMSGRVTSIDAAPSFTPENVYFKKDRIRQAFGIKVSIDHPKGLAKPGMPAEAEINLNSEKKRH